jgi:hypothetical protein
MGYIVIFLILILLKKSRGWQIPDLPPRPPPPPAGAHMPNTFRVEISGRTNNGTDQLHMLSYLALCVEEELAYSPVV